MWYLKPNIVIEPLIERWYAWSHLISPATAGMNVVGRHLKIMDSYIRNSNIHESAVKNPKMLGGPFMDYKYSRVKDIIKLREETLKNQAESILIAKSIMKLNDVLKESVKGYSLEEVYNDIPEELKGYVELVYDLNNNPSFRLFESLLYKSKFYVESSQSIALWQTNNDERPFCLSTARLDETDVIHVKIPLKDERIDRLSKMKREAGCVEEITDLLNIKQCDKELFNSFFTKDRQQIYTNYQGENVRMRYFGHACILIETNSVSILVDPLISYYGYKSKINHFSDIDLPDVIDYVLITHNHQDHILLETLLPLRHKIKKIVVPRTTSGSLQDPSIGLVFKNLGFKDVIEISDLEKIDNENLEIIGVPFIGEHSDLNIQAKSCFHVKIRDFTFLFVADSKIIEPKLYNYIKDIIGEVDVLFLGMECDGAPLTWLYGPLLPEELARDKDQSRRLSGSNYEKGIHLVNTFKPKEVYVYAMGQEPWLEFISTVRYSNNSSPIIQSDMLIKECISRGIIAERLYGEKEILYKN